jgi:hypothetical protein
MNVPTCTKLSPDELIDGNYLQLHEQHHQLYDNIVLNLIEAAMKL